MYSTMILSFKFHKLTEFEFKNKCLCNIFLKFQYKYYIQFYFIQPFSRLSNLIDEFRKFRKDFFSKFCIQFPSVDNNMLILIDSDEPFPFSFFSHFIFLSATYVSTHKTSCEDKFLMDTFVDSDNVHRSKLSARLR